MWLASVVFADVDQFQRSGRDCAVDSGPGANVAEVPRAHGVNANHMFAWGRAFELGELTQHCSALLPASTSFVRDAGSSAKCLDWEFRITNLHVSSELLAARSKIWINTWR